MSASAHDVALGVSPARATTTRPREVPECDGATQPFQRASGQRRTRQRGDILRAKILHGAWTELAQAGYPRFSIESSAHRAKVGKASIYRRWPTKDQLITAALDEILPTATTRGLVAPGDESTTASALLGLVTAISGLLAGPVGCVIRAVLGEATPNPCRVACVQDGFVIPCRTRVIDVLSRGVGRKEVRPDAVSRVVADLPVALLLDRIVLDQAPMPEQDLTDIVGKVVLPITAPVNR